MANIIIREREYPIHMSLNAISQIQQRYGGVEALAEKVNDLSEMPWVLSVMINEGMKLQALECGVPAKLVTAEQIGTLLDWRTLSDGGIAQAIVDCVNESLGGDEKNVSAEDLMNAASSLIP